MGRRDDTEQLVIVEDLLFVEFDRFWMGWNTEDDAKRIATGMVNDKNFSSNPEQISKRHDLHTKATQVRLAVLAKSTPFTISDIATDCP